MAIEINPNAKTTFQYPEPPPEPEDRAEGEGEPVWDKPTWTIRPLTLEEEHAVMDLEPKGIWASRAYMLRRALVDCEGHSTPFEVGPHGGASDSFIRSIPVTWRGPICSRILATITITEEDLEK